MMHVNHGASWTVTMDCGRVKGLDNDIRAISPDIANICAAVSTTEVSEALAFAIRRLGCEHAVFVPALEETDGSPIKPALSTLPDYTLAAITREGLFRNNPVLSHLRLTKQVLTVKLGSGIAVGGVPSRIAEILAPFAIAEAIFLPVISPAGHLSVLGVYGKNGSDLASRQEQLTFLGTAVSLKLLVLSALPSRPPGLTAFENDVLHWVAQGKSNLDVATILGTTPRMVAHHLSSIYAKLGVASRAQAAAAYARTRTSQTL